MTETLACFLPGRAKDLSIPLYVCIDIDQAVSCAKFTQHRV